MAEISSEAPKRGKLWYAVVFTLSAYVLIIAFFVVRNFNWDLFDFTGNDDYSASTYSGYSSGHSSSSAGGSSGSGYVSDDVPDDYKLALFLLAQDEVKAQLTSPSSAQFASTYTSADVVYSRDGDTYGMISWVEAENALGVTVRENFTLFATISDGTISDVTCIIGIPE